MQLVSRRYAYVFWMLFLLVLVGPVFHSLKVSRISYEFGAYYFYFSFIFSVLLLSSQLNKVRFYGSSIPFIILLLFLLMYGLLLSFFNTPDIFDFFGDLLRIIFVLLVVSVFSSFGFYFLLDDAVVKKIAVFSLISVFIGVAVLYLSFFKGVGVYFGLQSTLALVALSFGLVYRSYLFVILSVVAIILSGKRGVMISLVIVFFFYVLIFVLSKYKGRIFNYVLLGFLLTIIAFYIGIIPSSILDRVSIFFTSDSIDWRIATAGRNEEVFAVLEMFDFDHLKILFGFGLGGAFVNEGGVLDSTVHLSPLAVVLKFGVVGFVAFYSMISYFIVVNLVKCIRNSNVSESRSVIFWFLVFIGELSYSFTTFTLLQSFVLWLAFTLVLHERNFRSFATN